MSDYNGVLAMPHIPAETKTISALNSTTPLSNINDDFPKRLVECTGGVLQLDFDLGSTRPVNLVAALFTNAAADTTWELRAADNEAGLATGEEVVAAGTALYASSSSSNAEKPHGLWFGNAVTRRWWRIRITPGSAVPFRIGRLVLADGLQPYWNYQLPVRETPADIVIEERARSGRKVTDLIAPGRRLQLRFAELTETEYFDYAKPIHAAAATRRALIVLNPRADYAYRQEGIYWGDLVMVSDRQQPNEYSVSITLSETV